MDRKKENILNRLKGTGPGFTVPKTYFDSLEDRIDHATGEIDSNQEKFKENDKNDLAQNDSFTLDQIGKNPGFSVPDAYFDTIESKISGLKKTKVIPIKNESIRILSLSIAASILLFFGLNYMITKDNIQSQLVFQDEEFVKWIESDLVDLNTYEIAEAFNDVELELTLYAEDDIDEYLNSVDIENLILENR